MGKDSNFSSKKRRVLWPIILFIGCIINGIFIGKLLNGVQSFDRNQVWLLLTNTFFWMYCVFGFRGYARACEEDLETLQKAVQEAINTKRPINSDKQNLE